METPEGTTATTKHASIVEELRIEMFHGKLILQSFAKGAPGPLPNTLLSTAPHALLNYSTVLSLILDSSNIRCDAHTYSHT